MRLSKGCFCLVAALLAGISFLGDMHVVRAEEVSTSMVRYGDADKSGSCGENVKWSIVDVDGEDKLVISGSGDMTNFTSASDVPWKDYVGNIYQIEVGSGITSIGDYAFYGCNKIGTESDELVLADSITRIGNYALYGSGIFTEINLPSSLKEIGSYAFAGSRTLEKIVLPANVERVGDHAFYRSSCLTSIEITSNMHDIEKYAFADCNRLTTIKVNKGLRTIGERAFSGCTSLNNVQLSNNVNTIGVHSFDSCTSLTSINIPQRVDTIGRYAFANCSSLSTVTLSTNLNLVSDRAFVNCISLKSIEIPSGTINIQSYAFSGCTAMESVVIPATISNGLENAFLGCTNIKKFVNNSNQTFDLTLTDDKCIINDATGKSIEGVSLKNGSYSIKYKADILTVDPIPNYDYKGAAVTPSVVVSHGAYVLVENKDYTLTYNNNVKIGLATVYINCAGDYYGVKEATFNIVDPAKANIKVGKVSIKKPSNSAKKTLTVKWKKLSIADGYEVQIATNKKFTKGKKTIFINKKKTLSCKFKKLKKKKYYVRVRAFAYGQVQNKINGKWSAVKTIKIKK